MEAYNNEENVFAFDSEEHWGGGIMPSIKALNHPAALWISDENVDICNWVKECASECEDRCVRHYKNTTEYGLDLSKYGKTDINGKPLIISGRVITEPSMLIVNRSPLLLISKDKKSFSTRNWYKGYNKDLYQCIRRYLVLFLDNRNMPLHDAPLQLTSKGYFMVEFDTALMSFRKLLVEAYNDSISKHNSDNVYIWNVWHSMMVFKPTFNSEMRGPTNDKKSMACITSLPTSSMPNPTNWQQFTIGKAETESGKLVISNVFGMFNTNKTWWTKSFSKRVKEEEIDTLQLEDLSL